jgi:nitrogen regulation protein NR(I)
LTTPTVLVVDNDKTVCWVIERVLRKRGCRTQVAFDGFAALEACDQVNFDLVIADIKMPELDGLDMLSKLRAQPNPPFVIMITAHGTMQTAVEAMKRGAYDYVTKPFNLDELAEAAERALDAKTLSDRVREPLEAAELDSVDEMVGNSPPMQEVYKLIGRVSGTDVTVLIRGETGTGKELVARAIHTHSHRSSGPLTVVNCAALPHDLLESELFGHEKGAFTGAVSRRIGSFERAHGGTLFLDEIGTLDRDLQTRLLRVLQRFDFTRVGGNETIKVEARIVAATNRDLEAAVEAGEFREDLYFRLNVVPITLPPLRDRPEDIPHLIDHFLNRYNRECGTNFTLRPEVKTQLAEHDWPGHVRELENTIYRVAVLGQEHLTTSLRDDLEQRPDGLESSLATHVDKLLAGNEGDVLGRVVERVERPVIMRVLETTGGNQVRASKLLGINRNTLRTKMRKYGLTGT